MEEEGQRDREWSDEGEYEEMYSEQEVYDVLADLPRQVGIASDIADAIGCSPLTARNKLKELRFDRKVKKRDTGGRTILWYIPDETDGTDESDGGDETAEETADADATDDPDVVLKRLSHELDGPITTADGTVYEDGDKHPADE